MNQSLGFFETNVWNTSVDNWFDEVFQSRPVTKPEFGFTPAYDVQETESHYVVSLDVPGVAKENIKIEAIKNELVISGHRNEKPQTKFKRAFALPDGINLEKVEAVQVDGVLRIALPKAENPKPKQIEIRTTEKEGFFAKFLSSNEEKPLN